MAAQDEITIIKLNLGERVKTLRKEQDLSQESFSMMIGLTRSYVSKIENGGCNPTLDALFKISRGFGMSLPELIDGIDPQAPTQGASYAFLKMPR